jgi:hypothetical protein
MPREPIRAPLGVNVPGSAMAGFQPTLYGRFWVTAEVNDSGEDDAIRSNVRETILSVFGENSPEYREHQYLDILGRRATRQHERR